MVVFFAVEKTVESMAISKKIGSSSESSGSSSDSEADGTGNIEQILPLKHPSIKNTKLSVYSLFHFFQD